MKAWYPRHPATRLALQAVAALLLIELLNLYVRSPRSYWASMSAISVLCQTWGESLRKSTRRILATILGFAAGLGLHEILPGQTALFLIVVFLLLFFLTYNASVHYGRFVFFLSVLMALVLAGFGGPLPRLYLERVLATLVGAGMAILVSLSLFPAHVKRQLDETIAHYLHAVRTEVDLLFDILENPPPLIPRQPTRERRELFAEIRKQVDLLTREMAFRREPGTQPANRWREIEMMDFYLNNLNQMVRANLLNPLVPLFADELRTLHTEAIRQLEQNARPPAPPAPGNRLPLPPLDAHFTDHLTQKIARLIENSPHNRIPLIELLPLFYYTRKMLHPAGTGGSRNENT